MTAQSTAPGTATARRAAMEGNVRELVYLRHVQGLGDVEIQGRLGRSEKTMGRYRAYLADHPELLADELSVYFSPQTVAEVIAAGARQPPAPAGL